MSTSNVVSLEELRGQRDKRLRLALAMHRVDENRRVVAERLREALDLAHADRAALVWIDEYGPGLVHAHCVLDLVSDRPRRRFAIEPLRRAWEQGIPGLLDEPDLTSSGRRILVEGPRSLGAVALGSDGLRAWFLIVDSKTPRSSLDSGAVDDLMFLAGECASIVIHEDVDVARRGPGGSAAGEVEEGDRWAGSSLFERERRSRFPGWHVLRDVDDETDDGGRDRAVTRRFLVTRLLRELVDDDFAVDGSVFQKRIEAVRGEIRESWLTEGTPAGWKQVLDAMEEKEYGRLARSVLNLAVDAEDEGHLHGARELDRLAYDVAVAGGHAPQAVNAGRFLGRVNRRLGAWEESERWYKAAEDVAEAAGLKRGRALALDGLGNTYRVRGNLPGAREAYHGVLAMGEALHDPDLRGRGHQNLALVEKHAGRTDEALRHGWEAVESFLGTNDIHFFRALADLGDIFLRCGELTSAEHAFEVVAAGVENLDVRVAALDALGHVEALRGDRAAFQRRLQRLEAEALDSVAVELSAEILLHRGESWIALGEPEEAERCLRRCVELAEKHGVNRVLFEAEERIGEVSAERGSEVPHHELPAPSPETMSALEAPLHALTPAAGVGG